MPSDSKADISGDVFMELSQVIDAEMLLGFFKDVISIGFLPGFMLTTLLHLMGYGIFKALSFLNIRR